MTSQSMIQMSLAIVCCLSACHRADKAACDEFVTNAETAAAKSAIDLPKDSLSVDYAKARAEKLAEAKSRVLAMPVADDALKAQQTGYATAPGAASDAYAKLAAVPAADAAGRAAARADVSKLNDAISTARGQMESHCGTL